MTRRNVLLGIVAWVAVVALGSGVTWVVIDAAGQQVLSDAPVTAPAAGPPSPWSASPTASPRPHRTRHSEHTRSPTPAPTLRPPAPPSPRATPSRPAPTRSSEASPESREATWRGVPGTVVASCTGARVSLVSATPSNGYRVEVGGRGPAQVEVTFKGGAETQVQAHCVGGAPRFGTEAETEGGDG